MAKRIVITGLGIVAPNGKGRQDFWQGLKEGRIGYRPVTLFDTSEFAVKQAGEVSDFDPKIYMGIKGLRTLDRSTMLLVSAAKMAIDDSRFTITDQNTDDVGVSVGTTLGSLKSISEFDEITIKEGPRYTNPALFPNTVINSPASQVSIWHHIQGFNTTISTGFTASLDAMQYAYDFLDMDRVKIVYTGGVEEMCFHTFFGFHALKFLSGAKEGTDFINCPFDKRRNGIVFGEGAAMMSLESLEDAKARQANILAEIISIGYSFDPRRIHKYIPDGRGVKQAMRDALGQADMGPQDIDYICANANSTVLADKIEAESINEVFGSYGKKVLVSAPKSMFGECYSVSGSFGVAAALAALNEQFIPPTVNYQEPDPACDLNIVANKSRPAKLKNVMVVNFGPSGNNICVILRKVEKS